MAVDVTIHLDDVQEMLVGEYAETLGVDLGKCFEMVMECELEDYLAGLGAAIEASASGKSE